MLLDKNNSKAITCEFSYSITIQQNKIQTPRHTNTILNYNKTDHNEILWFSQQRYQPLRSPYRLKLRSLTTTHELCHAKATLTYQQTLSHYNNVTCLTTRPTFHGSISSQTRSFNDNQWLLSSDNCSTSVRCKLRWVNPRPLRRIRVSYSERDFGHRFFLDFFKACRNNSSKSGSALDCFGTGAEHDISSSSSMFPSVEAKRKGFYLLFNLNSKIGAEHNISSLSSMLPSSERNIFFILRNRLSFEKYDTSD